MQGDQCSALHPLPQGSAGLQGSLGLTPPVDRVPFWQQSLEPPAESGTPIADPPHPHHSQAEQDIYQCEMRGVQKNMPPPPPPQNTNCLRGKKSDPVSLQKCYSGACAGNKKVEGPLPFLWGRSCARGAAEHMQPWPCTESERVLVCSPRLLSDHSTIHRECTVPTQGGYMVGTHECPWQCWGPGVGEAIPVLPKAVLHPLLWSVTAHSSTGRSQATQILSRKALLFLSLKSELSNSMFLHTPI